MSEENELNGAGFESAESAFIILLSAVHFPMREQFSYFGGINE